MADSRVALLHVELSQFQLHARLQVADYDNRERMMCPTARQVDTELFSSMPTHYRRSDVVTSWSRLNRMGLPGDCFIEGPVFDDSGDLFITDIEYGRVFRIDPGVLGRWSPTGMANRTASLCWVQTSCSRPIFATG